MDRDLYWCECGVYKRHHGMALGLQTRILFSGMVPEPTILLLARTPMPSIQPMVLPHTHKLPILHPLCRKNASRPPLTEGIICLHLRLPRQEFCALRSRFRDQ
jgi:hypothetical protein